MIFQGICNPPDEILEATFRITATNRMNLQRLLLPQVRIQRRCPWEFPARRGAAGGGGGRRRERQVFALLPVRIFGGCGGRHGDAGRRRRLSRRAATRGRTARRAGCSAISAESSSCRRRSRCGRTGTRAAHTSAVAVNEARYNDFVPMVYGTAWYQPPVVFARNDGNLTRMEVLLGMGEMQGVLKVLVNDVEIPAGVNGTNMTGTGWYNIPTLGTRRGGFNGDFMDGSGQPAGDPYGSMAYLSRGGAEPDQQRNDAAQGEVLVQGLKLPRIRSRRAATAASSSRATRRGCCWTSCGGRVEHGGNRHRELRGGGGVLR